MSNLKQNILFGPSLQELLLRHALREISFPYKRSKIGIDHLNGKSYVNSVQLGIIYPRSYQFRALNGLNGKSLDYYFNGAQTPSGGRDKLLLPFVGRGNSRIVSSLRGRSRLLKGKFNRKYFCALGAAKFGLCPHHQNWCGPVEAMWTYRFIECCICMTIPVLFREAPLGTHFVDGFRFFYAEDYHVYSTSDALHNWELASERFFLSGQQISALFKTILK